MGQERIALLGHLKDEELQAGQLRTRLEGLRDSIRSLTDRYTPVEHLPGAALADQAVQFAATQEVYKDKLVTIAAIKRDLGQ